MNELLILAVAVSGLACGLALIYRAYRQIDAENSRQWAEGYQAACRARWNADAERAYRAGFEHGHGWDGTLWGAKDAEQVVTWSWEEYQRDRTS